MSSLSLISWCALPFVQKLAGSFGSAFPWEKECVRFFVTMLWHNLLRFLSLRITDSYNISGICPPLLYKFNNLISDLSLKHL